MKKQIRIYFTDFWATFNINDNYFLNLLKNDFDVIIDSENPEFLFYSNFGINYHNYNCVRIYFTGENKRPDFNQCDRAFSFDFSEDNRNYRLPLYALFADLSELMKPRDAKKLLDEKTGFCNFIYSNPGPVKRKEIFEKLSRYKKIDSAGRYLNNIGGPIGGFEKEKREYIRKYKFTIAFENSSYPGYTSEKILDPLLCGSIPLYWGNKEVDKDFNPKSFINYHDFENDDDFINKIIEIDNDDALYLEMISQPPFVNNEINEFVNPENVRRWLCEIINNQQIKPVSANSPLFSDSKFKSLSYKIKINFNYHFNKLLNKFRTFSFNKIIVKIYKILEK